MSEKEVKDIIKDVNIFLSLQLWMDTGQIIDFYEEASLDL